MNTFQTIVGLRAEIKADDEKRKNDVFKQIKDETSGFTNVMDGITFLKIFFFFFS